ncbi:biotinidase [Oryzias melastigma]|uniref:Biotinidase n=1 Tax=Oryzias melastigma TaxID=30732 RepID=A0A3B3DMT1_ORYME|nr:biotinidase [Oryzias melastigma]
MLFLVFFVGLFSSPTETVGDSYVAGVFEHRVILNPDPRVPVTRHEALQHMTKNLDVYEEQATRAAQQGVDILVFPEDGIHGFNFTRSSISAYLETIPDPQQETWNPCMEPGRHNNTEVLQRLSCIARRNKLYVVANMPDLQPCPLPSDPSSSCPPDGRWQFNTNVVFSSEGQLVARYHKQNLYYEYSFDTPPQPEIITFDTPFGGRFGLMVCFDLLFRDPTVTLVERGVRQLIFPTAWMNALPLLDSIQFQRAFSLGANVTLLAANTRNDRLIMTGSGIFTPFSATYHHAQEGDPEEGKLLVARVPVLEGMPGVVAEEGKAPKTKESSADHSADPISSSFISYMLRDPYTFVLLNETKQDDLKVCSGTFCCALQYKWTAQSKELYALGAFSGRHKVNGSYTLQVCAVVRCANEDPSSCGQKVEEAESKMDFVLEGWFDTKYVYPSVLVSRMVLEQPDQLEKTEDGRVAMKHGNMGGGLITACLYGRTYHLDTKKAVL